MGFTGSSKDSAAGLGDTTLIHVMRGWKDELWNYNAAVIVYAPNGSYSASSVANTCLNYWTQGPTLDIAYSNENAGFNATLIGGSGIDSENPDTQSQQVRLQLQSGRPRGSSSIALRLRH